MSMRGKAAGSSHYESYVYIVMVNYANVDFNGNISLQNTWLFSE